MLFHRHLSIVTPALALSCGISVRNPMCDDTQLGAPARPRPALPMVTL